MFGRPFGGERQSANKNLVQKSILQEHIQVTSVQTVKNAIENRLLRSVEFNVQIVPGIVINVYFGSMREVFRFVLRFDVPFQIVHLFLRPVTHDLTRQILTVVEIKVRRAHCLIGTVSTIVLEVANIGLKVS